VVDAGRLARGGLVGGGGGGHRRGARALARDTFWEGALLVVLFGFLYMGVCACIDLYSYQWALLINPPTTAHGHDGRPLHVCAALAPSIGTIPARPLLCAMTATQPPASRYKYEPQGCARWCHLCGATVRQSTDGFPTAPGCLYFFIPDVPLIPRPTAPRRRAVLPPRPQSRLSRARSPPARPVSAGPPHSPPGSPSVTGRPEHSSRCGSGGILGSTGVRVSPRVSVCCTEPCGRHVVSGPLEVRKRSPASGGGDATFLALSRFL
jgi:hypothetical protein